jgi:hypothetical protein
MVSNLHKIYILYLITLSTFSIPVFPKDWPEDGTFMPKHVASNVIQLVCICFSVRWPN